MERKWEQRILPPIPLKLCTKHSLGQTESMSQMQMSITVRIGEGDNKFLLLAPIVIVAGVTLKGLFTFPHSLNFHLGGTQGIALGGSLGSGADGKVGHLGGRRSGWCHFAQYILDADTTALSLAAMNVSGGNLLPAVTLPQVIIYATASRSFAMQKQEQACLSCGYGTSSFTVPTYPYGGSSYENLCHF